MGTLDDCSITARDRWRRADPQAIGRHQLEALNRLLRSAVAHQPLYREKYRDAPLPLRSLDDLAQLPMLGKGELVGAGPATICGWPRRHYVRLHQTSGTTGEPIRLFDSADDWRWWLECWQYVLDAAEATPEDTAFIAFSYGPFIGFWTAHDACVQRGLLVIAGGGMDSLTRLKVLTSQRATLLCCTPTYALYLAGLAAQHGIDLAASDVSRIIVAGEPGGSIPATRRQIEQAWGARLIDHSGATEVGAWGVGSRDGSGLHVIESQFIAERLVFDGEAAPRPAADGELAELVITGLGRRGAPAIRYRTGDLVRARPSDDPDNRFLLLEGGVVGRADDMVVVRGVNVFPSSVEAILRRVAGRAEYRVLRSRKQGMQQLTIQLETEPDDDSSAARLANALREQLGLRIEVEPVRVGTLPRFQAKARRWVDAEQQESR